MKTRQVFLSHTSDMAKLPEGRPFVQAALDAVSRARLTPVDMRYFSARDGKPADYCRQQVRACDIYVAIIGFRYGSLVAGESVSYTEMEFLTASAAGLPRLVFLLAEAAAPAALADADPTLVTEFRKRLSEAGLIVREFTSSEALELEVFHAISELSSGSLDGPLDAPEYARFPLIWNVPNRNADFTGRATVLERLRSELAGDGTAAVLAQALYGLGGVGKTQVALEYAHRYMGEYDLVWWIPAEQPQAISLAMAELAGRLGIQTSDNASEATGVVLDRLRQGAGGRWLLIFDNAEDPADLEPFLPGGPGHVIVTSRNHAWSRRARPVELDVFSRRESTAHLMEHVPGLDTDSAARIADAVGDLPLAVGQAAAWLAETGMPAGLYAERLEAQAARDPGLGEPFGYAMPVAATWDLSLRRLSERSPAAVRLLQILAFCSPEPVSATLLYGEEMNAALLPFDEALRDRLALGAVIREAGRLALIRVHRGSASVQMHRLVQGVIRSQMTAEQQAEARHTVHRVLAAARPGHGDTDDPANWSVYDIIWPHLEPSSAEECDDEQTRELLLDWTRYQRIHGELESGAVLAERLRRLWARELGPDHGQTLRVQYQLASILREQNRFSAARDLSTQVLKRQRAVLGASHTDTLATTYLLAAALRGLGDFGRALALDRKAYASFKKQFGADYRQTLRAAHNLAVSLRLAGDFAAARRLDEQTVERLRRVLGPSHPSTLLTTRSLGRDLRETGALRESVELLLSTYDACRAVLGDEVVQTLYTANSLSVSLRRTGEVDDAMRLSEATYRCLLKNHGPRALHSLACALNLASNYSAQRDHARALALATEAHAGYQESLGDNHSHTLAARNSQMIFLCETGDLSRALALGEQTVSAMRAHLGEDHPLTLSGTVNLANCLGDAPDLRRAASLQRETIAALQRTRGTEHPVTLACEANLAVTLHKEGAVPAAEQARTASLDKLSRTLGAEHPDTSRLRDWQYINCDFDPLGI